MYVSNIMQTKHNNYVPVVSVDHLRQESGDFYNFLKKGTPGTYDFWQTCKYVCYFQEIR